MSTSLLIRLCLIVAFSSLTNCKNGTTESSTTDGSTEKSTTDGTTQTSTTDGTTEKAPKETSTTTTVSTELSTDSITDANQTSDDTTEMSTSSRLKSIIEKEKDIISKVIKYPMVIFNRIQERLPRNLSVTAKKFVEFNLEIIKFPITLASKLAKNFPQNISASDLVGVIKYPFNAVYNLVNNGTNYLKKVAPNVADFLISIKDATVGMFSRSLEIVSSVYLKIDDMLPDNFLFFLLISALIFFPIAIPTAAALLLIGLTIGLAVAIIYAMIGTLFNSGFLISSIGSGPFSVIFGVLIGMLQNTMNQGFGLSDNSNDDNEENSFDFDDSE